jgi:DNA repair protein RadC
MSEEEKRSGAITSWPEMERPREKMHAQGVETLMPSELLAVLLRTGDGRGATALDLGRRIWLDYGESWKRLAFASPAELAKVHGIGPAKAASVAAALEIARRLGATPIEKGGKITDPKEVYAHFIDRLDLLTEEAFFALLLDTKGKLLREELISKGSLNESIVHPREAFRSAVREGAAAILFVHNHPSGDPAPSREDVELTKRLLSASELMGITLVDHVIVARDGYYSFMHGDEDY